jgi:transglutaminase-like putative cysteine protease
MIRLKTNCCLDFQIASATPLVLMLRPRSTGQQWVISETYTLTPFVTGSEYLDFYNNLCQRLVAPPGHFSICTTAEVMTPASQESAPGAEFIEIQNLPDSVLAYLLPSRYCESDRFGDLALQIVGAAQPGYDQAALIEQWVRNNIRYIPGSSSYPIASSEVNSRGVGVCRDLAHLGISLCRSISIPARLVVGFLQDLQPMDLHAWFEVYVGDRWYTLDPTQNNSLSGGRVSIAHGRDAADVSVFHQFGPGEILTNLSVDVELLSDSPK